MKSKTAYLSKIALGLVTIVVLSTAPHAAAVPARFPGGTDSPFSLSPVAPVRYTITATPGWVLPLFVFQAVGTSGFGDAISGGITSSVNGDLTQILSGTPSGFGTGIVTVSDLVFWGAVVFLDPDDVITLSAGTWTTLSPFTDPASLGGSYNKLIGDSVENLLSADASSAFPVTESFSTLWLTLPLVGIVAARRFVGLHPRLS